MDNITNMQQPTARMGSVVTNPAINQFFLKKHYRAEQCRTSEAVSSTERVNSPPTDLTPDVRLSTKIVIVNQGLDISIRCTCKTAVLEFFGPVRDRLLVSCPKRLPPTAK